MYVNIYLYLWPVCGGMGDEQIQVQDHLTSRLHLNFYLLRLQAVHNVSLIFSLHSRLPPARHSRALSQTECTELLSMGPTADFEIPQ